MFFWLRLDYFYHSKRGATSFLTRNSVFSTDMCLARGTSQDRGSHIADIRSQITYKSPKVRAMNYDKAGTGWQKVTEAKMFIGTKGSVRSKENISCSPEILRKSLIYFFQIFTKREALNLHEVQCLH